MESRKHFSVIFLVSVVCKSLSFGLVLGLCSSVNASPTHSALQLWQSLETTEFDIQARTLNRSDDVNNTSSDHSYENAKMMTLNKNLMFDLLELDSSGVNIFEQATSSYEIAAKGIDSDASYRDHKVKYNISLPLPDGSIINLSLMKDSLLPEQLAAKYPDINTYKILANDRVFSGKVDISPSGFHAMLQMFDGEIIFIDPTDLNKSQYAVYHKSAQKTDDHRLHSCGLNDELFSKNIFGNSSGFDINSLLLAPKASAKNTTQVGTDDIAARTNNSLKNYTIAIATTGEYSAKFGGTVGATMAAIVTTLNRVNQILERDLGIHLNLVENNDLLINTDVASDPFTESKLLDLVFQNQEFIDDVIGKPNYDIGHLFTTKGGGLAAIASVCNHGNKAKGASGTTSPKGDSFDLDFVAHEIGHQLGATHTFNSSQGACSNETRTARTAFEPGSGSSIMSYAGYCGLDNIQSNTDAMFHIGSIKQIVDYTSNGYGNRCGEVKSSENTPPLTDAGPNYIIPARTPFELKGKAIDQDGDPLIYAWEQLDAGESSTQSLDKGDNALFRIHAPDSSNHRSFPPLENILNNQTAKGETLANYNRNLTMSFVAQDGFNVAQSDEMVVKVIRTGSRFALNYPRAFYTRGDTYPIYWNVANTNKPPINCTSVNVSLSLDGGNNFDYLLGDNIPNTGETSVTFPADIPTSTKGRLKIKCSDNIFFAISYRNFFVTEFDDSISIEFNNEDQAESNLKDLPLGSSPPLSSSVVSTNVGNNTSSGGGAFGIFIHLFLILFIRGSYNFCNIRKMSNV